MRMNGITPEVTINPEGHPSENDLSLAIEALANEKNDQNQKEYESIEISDDDLKITKPSKSPTDKPQDGQPGTKIKKLMTSFNDMPKIPEFGNFEQSERRAEFRKWLLIVKQTMEFARNWDKRTGAAWLSLVSGPNLRRLIDIYNITTNDEDRPFSGLLEAIDRKFDQMTDATVEYRRLIAFKQAEGQSVTSFFEQYMEMVKGMDLSEREIRTYFVLKLRDEKLKEHAAAFDLEPEAIVMASMRKELLSEATTSSNTPAVVATIAASQEGEVQAVVRSRRSHPYAGRPRKPQRSNALQGRFLKPCHKCGLRSHRTGTCPADGKSCLTCGELGHFAKVCKNGNRNDRRANGSDKVRSGFN
jgi:hypothetical protein